MTSDEVIWSEILLKNFFNSRLNLLPLFFHLHQVTVDKTAITQERIALLFQRFQGKIPNKVSSSFLNKFLVLSFIISANISAFSISSLLSKIYHFFLTY